MEISLELILIGRRPSMNPQLLMYMVSISTMETLPSLPRLA